jgi:hypothetical protein
MKLDRLREPRMDVRRGQELRAHDRSRHEVHHGHARPHESARGLLVVEYGEAGARGEVVRVRDAIRERRADVASTKPLPNPHGPPRAACARLHRSYAES